MNKIQNHDNHKDYKHYPTTERKLKIYINKDNKSTSNYIEWFRDIEDMIGNEGPEYREQLSKMKFQVFNLDEVKMKYAIIPIKSTSKEAWLPSDEQYASLIDIEDDNDRKRTEKQLYIAWAQTQEQANAENEMKNIVSKKLVEKAIDDERNDELKRSKLFSAIRHSFQTESRINIENHVVVDYVKDASTDEFVSRDFKEAERLSDFIWLIKAAQETHVRRLVGDDTDEIENRKDYEDNILKNMKHSNGRFSDHVKAFKYQVEICDAVGKKYEDTDIRRIFMRSLNDELFETDKNDYKKPAMKASYGETFGDLVNIICRKYDLMQRENIDKVLKVERIKKEPSFAAREMKKKKDDDKKREGKLHKWIDYPECDICGKRNHLVDDCFYYKKKHSSIEEARADFLRMRDRDQTHEEHDNESIASGGSRSNPTKGTVAEPKSKVNRIVDGEKKKYSYNRSGIIFVQGDTCAASNMMHEKYATFSNNVSEDIACLYGVGGGKLNSKLSTINTLGLTRFVADETEENTISIPQATRQGKGDWKLEIDSADGHMILKHKGSKHNPIHFYTNYEQYGDYMPRAKLPMKDFMSIYGGDNIERSYAIEEFKDNESIDSNLEAEYFEFEHSFGLNYDDFNALDKARRDKLAEEKQAKKEQGFRFPMKRISEAKTEKMRAFKVLAPDKEMFLVGEVWCNVID